MKLFIWDKSNCDMMYGWGQPDNMLIVIAESEKAAIELVKTTNFSLYYDLQRLDQTFHYDEYYRKNFFTKEFPTKESIIAKFADKGKSRRWHGSDLNLFSYERLVEMAFMYGGSYYSMRPEWMVENFVDKQTGYSEKAYHPRSHEVDQPFMLFTDYYSS